MGLEQNMDAGIYCRLSKDDERTGESVSIENQKLMLQKYVKEQGWNEVEVYCDDGYSGTNFERPAVKRMIEDAKAGRINIIVVKDLSRFGRNYIEIGQYTDYLFPTIGCRFIALSNGVDTMTQGSGNDMMGFVNLFNEFHSRDTSRKVRAVKKSYAEQGKFIAAKTPLGYMRSPDDHNSLAVDEENAPLVRRIFDMRCSGMGYHKIAVTLNDEKIPTPSAIYYARESKAPPSRWRYVWSGTTVRQLLRNEVYIGNMVNGKSSPMSYKNKQVNYKPREEWIRVENTHEPIITREVWDLCAALEKERYIRHEKPNLPPSVLTGLVRCGTCHAKMHIRRNRKKSKDASAGYYTYFDCGTYRRAGMSACSPHSIREEILLDLVLTDIREKARAVVLDAKAIAERIVKMKTDEEDTHMAGYERELRAALTRQPEVEKLMMNLYEDRIKGALPETVFATLMQKYEAEQSGLSARIAELQEKIQTSRQCAGDAGVWMRHIRKYATLNEVDESILVELVEHIEVGDSYKENGKTFRDISVVYRYVGNVDNAVALVLKEAA